jgi:peptidoglycan hydrolase-like protein with peptidoglycan-binding domain
MNVGDFGDDVARLHEKLRARGFDVPPEEVKRKFYGPATRDAVRECQKRHGREVTGEVGEATAAVLEEAMVKASKAPMALSVGARAERPVRGHTIEPISAPIKVNDRGPHVANLQDALRLLVERGKLDISALGTTILEVLARERTLELYGDDGTLLLVKGFQAQYQLPITGRVDDETAATLNKLLKELGAFEDPQQPIFVVRGQVRYADGRPAAGQQVRAFDRDLRSEEPLGEAITDDSGRYEITYTAEQFSRAEKGSADLIVRVSVGPAMPPVSSPIIFNAQPVETVDLTVDGVYRGPSEYDQLVAQLTPLLEGLSFAELTEDDKHQDVTFLSGETSQDPDRITFLIAAHRLLKDTEVPAEVFYGLFRQGLPVQLPALLAQSPDVQCHALIRSAQANIISPAFADEADAILERFKALVVREALKRPAEGGNGRPMLADLLGVTLPDAQLREDFLSAYVNHALWGLRGAVGVDRWSTAHSHRLSGVEEGRPLQI